MRHRRRKGRGSIPTRRRGRLLLLALCLSMAAGAGCLDRGVFRCSKNSQCQTATTPSGFCESTGACSYPDASDACGSGRRYSNHAPDPFANQCVENDCAVNPVDRIRGGGSHACEVRQNGSVACWGAGTEGQLGDGTTWSRSSPIAISDALLGKTADVALGGRHTCALLKGDGSVWCWGANEWGQLGDGSTTSRATPTQVLDESGAPLSDVQAIAAGGAFTCAAHKTGDVLCWGRNVDGELGIGNATSLPSIAPQPVMALSAVTELSARDRHACALAAGGRVWCWGSNEQGELGDGTQISSPFPVAASLPLDSSVEQIATGAAHTCAREGGKLWCWGTNTLGELGDGSDQNQAIPVVVPLPDVSDVVAAGHHTCARESDGTVWCWGANQSGQLGEGTTSNFAVPVPVTGIEDGVDLAAGDFFSCVRRHDGTVWCWGDDRLGQLGTGSDIEHLAPAPVRDPVVDDAASISAGGSHTCAVRRPNATGQQPAAMGRIVCWGDNQAGQIGDGTHADRSTPTPLKINLDADQVATGSLHTCLRDNKGGIWCWGRGGSGQLGTPALIDVIVPTNVAGLGETTSVAAGQAHTCAVLRDQSVWCWGGNSDGQLGDSTNENRSTPAAVPGQTGVVQIVLGGGHTCARYANQTVRCWGLGTNGQLGNGSGTTSADPVNVDGIDNAVAITAGAAHTCVILGDGTVQCWGAGKWGQLGWGPLQDHSIPSAVKNLTGVVEIAAGDNHTCARTSPDGKPETPGSIYCWGDNRAGQLGKGTREADTGKGPDTNAPTISGDTISVTAGGTHSCAIKRDHTIVCWGADNAGQLGDAASLQSPTPQRTRTPCP